MKKAAILLSFILSTQISVAKSYTSQPYKTEILELFSSEGCSSCPPAEAQISKLKYHPKIWTSFIPINFHVDYWNKLGWNDPFSKSLFTDRQRQYASQWSTKTVYTPAFVMQSKDLGPILNTAQLDQFKNEKSLAKIKITVNSNKKNYQVKAEIEGLDSKKNYDLHIALLGHDLISKINSGENSGRTLIQNFVALSYKQMSVSKNIAETQLELTDSVNPSKVSVVAWLTEKNNLQVIQSVGGDM